MKKKSENGQLFFSRTNDFLNKYLPLQAGKSKNTIETYRDGLTVFRRYVTDTRGLSIRKFRFSDCNSEFILDYLAFLNGSGCAASTCNSRLAALRAYLWYASDLDISVQSIALGASHVPFIKGQKKEKAMLSNEALKLLLAAPPNTKIGNRDRAIMILLFDSAIRVSELTGLTVGSVRLDAAYIHVHGKGNKERIVAITDKTVQHLRSYIKQFHTDKHIDAPLFYSRIKGNIAPMSSGNIARIINKYADQIRPDCPELPERVHPHMFRRTRATGLYRSGVELEMISVILGHSSTQTTRIYATPSVEMIWEAMSAATADYPEEVAEWEADETELARLCGLR